MSLMSLGGFALTSDHTHLVYQRDVLKAATDAASLAASRHWQQALGHLTDDNAIKTALLPLAKRYILANIPENRREDANATLQVTITLHHGAGMVDVDASADLSGGLIFAGWMLNGTTVQALKITKAETRTERLQAGGIIEVVLAIDRTSSMGGTLSGKNPADIGEDSRMTIVKQAAKDLVDILTATGAPIAVGVVPWHFRVKFNDSTRKKWEDEGWAEYPSKRYYPNPHWKSWKKIGRTTNVGWYPDPHLDTAAGEWHDLPTKPGTWKGCVDQRRVSGDDPPGILAVLPTTTPLTMGFYSPTVAYPRDKSISLECDATDPTIDPDTGLSDRPSGKKDECFTGTGHAATSEQSNPQFNCRNDLSTILPLTTDMNKVKQKINSLSAGGSATYSTLGVVWGHRLLASTWRGIWGDATATHPVDKAKGVQKAIVLLTDGDDNHFDPVIVRDHRNKACTAAKKAGIKVFTVAAMERSRVGELGGHLKRCSSQADDPKGGYVFINNTTPDDLKGAFQEIARQLVRFRRVY